MITLAWLVMVTWCPILILVAVAAPRRLAAAAFRATARGAPAYGMALVAVSASALARVGVCALAHVAVAAALPTFVGVLCVPSMSGPIRRLAWGDALFVGAAVLSIAGGARLVELGGNQAALRALTIALWTWIGVKAVTARRSPPPATGAT